MADRADKTGPDGARWQQALSASHDRIGAVQQAQGNLAGALDACHR